MCASPGPEAPAFIRKQYAFAAHIRDPQNNPPPQDVEDRRMAIYRELFYNNVQGFLAAGFPVIRHVLSDEHWHGLVRDFFSRHRCHTPLFAEIAREFLGFLQEERGEVEDDPPFLLELAHYEWVELALDIAEEDTQSVPLDPNGDLLADIPVFSPLAWNLTYQFPVHRIGPEFQPWEPGRAPSHLVVYRDRADRVAFLEINQVTQRLIQLLKESPTMTGLDAVNHVSQELSHPKPEIVTEAGRGLLEQLRQRHIILGTRTT